MANTIVLSDESLNSYGYRVLTEGIRLERFEANPIMFYNHNSWNSPIGRWENIRKEGDKLLADPVFDKKDTYAQKIEQKFKDKFLNASSIGFMVHDFKLVKDEVLNKKILTITDAEIFEASIVDMPANANAVRLKFAAGLQPPAHLFETLNQNSNPIDIMKFSNKFDQFLAALGIKEIEVKEGKVNLQEEQVEKLEAALGEVDQLKKEKEGLELSNANLTTDKATLEAERDGWKAKADEKDAEIDRLKAKVERLEGRSTTPPKNGDDDIDEHEGYANFNASIYDEANKAGL